MNLSIVIGIIVVAVVAWFLWNRNKGAAAPPAATSAPPAPTPAPAAPLPGRAAAAPLGSYDDYRRVSPSNMVYGKLTCNRCGSNLLSTSGGVASCGSCGAALYRA